MIFLYSNWMQLSLATRHKIASEFGFTKKRSTHVANDVIVDDGFVIKEIEEALTLNNMQNYLGTTETDVHILWNYLVDKIEGRNIQIIDVIAPAAYVEPEPVPTPEPEQTPEMIKHLEEMAIVKTQFKGKRGRPKSK